MSHFNVIAKLACCGLMVFLASCGSAHDQDEKYYLISTNVKIPYWQAGSAGLFQAAQQLKVRSEFAGPDSYDPKAEQKNISGGGAKQAHRNSDLRRRPQLVER